MYSLIYLYLFMFLTDLEMTNSEFWSPNTTQESTSQVNEHKLRKDSQSSADKPIFNSTFTLPDNNLEKLGNEFDLSIIEVEDALQPDTTEPADEIDRIENLSATFENCKIEKNQKEQKKIACAGISKKMRRVECYNVVSGEVKLDKNLNAGTLKLPQDPKMKGRPRGSKNQKKTIDLIIKTYENKNKTEKQALLLEAIFGKKILKNIIIHKYIVTVDDLPDHNSFFRTVFMMN